MTEQEKTDLVIRANHFFISWYGEEGVAYDAFEEQMHSENKRRGLTVYKDTIKEHDLLYSMRWGYKDEEYQDNSERTQWMGVGAILVSKVSEHISPAGSGKPLEYAIEHFELLIMDLEELVRIEVQFTKEKVAQLKRAFDCSTSELLQMVDKDSIIVKEFEAHSFDVSFFKRKLEEANAQFQVRTDTRKIDRSEPLFTIHFDLVNTSLHKDILLKIKQDEKNGVVADSYFLSSFLRLLEETINEPEKVVLAYLEYARSLLGNLGAREVFLPVDLSDQYVGGIFAYWDLTQLVKLSYGYSTSIQGHSIDQSCIQELVSKHKDSFKMVTYWSGKKEQMMLGLDTSYELIRRG